MTTLDTGDRRTGRTTRALIEALDAAAADPARRVVYVVTDPYLVEYALEMIRKHAPERVGVVKRPQRSRVEVSVAPAGNLIIISARDATESRLRGLHGRGGAPLIVPDHWCINFPALHPLFSGLP